MNYKELSKVLDSVSVGYGSGVSADDIENAMGISRIAFQRAVLSVIKKTTPYNIGYLKFYHSYSMPQDEVRVYCYHAREDRNALVAISTYWREGLYQHCTVGGGYDAVKKTQKELDSLLKGMFADKLLQESYELCGIESLDAKLSVQIVEYRDYKPVKEMTLKGTVEEVFNTMSDMNERLKYINGSYYKFKLDDYAQLYRMWSLLKGTGYFISRAASHGATID